MVNNNNRRNYRQSRKNKPLFDVFEYSRNLNTNTYAKIGQDFKRRLSGLQNVTVTDSVLDGYLRDPLANYINIAQAAINLAFREGEVKNWLNYIVSLPTYNHNIFAVPNEKSNYKTSATVKDYIDVANYLDKYDIKTYAPYFIERTLINGMSFFYEVQNTSGVAYWEFPISMCRIYMVEDGIYKWCIDVTKLQQDIIDNPLFPKDIREAKLKEDKTNPEEFYENKWYLVKNKKAVAFCLDQSVISNGGIATSHLLPFLKDITSLQTAKANIDIKNKVDAVRLIHGKIPKDKDGKITVSAKDAAEWNKLLKNGIPEGIDVVTTPFDMDSINLSGAANAKAYDTVKDASRQLFQGAGVSSQLFGDDTDSSVVIKFSITKDISWTLNRFLPMLTKYYNKVLSNVKTESGMTWRIHFLRQSNMTLDEDVKRYKDAITVGGSRTDYLASMGQSPLDVYSKLLTEQQVLNIDALMVPKESSYTMSGKSSSGSSDAEVGRPETSEPTDDTDRLRSAQ